MKKIAFLMCSETVGGHEFQSVELIKLVSSYCECTVFCNNQHQLGLFEGIKANIKVTGKPFFRNQMFLFQFARAVINIYKLRPLLSEYDKIVVCAGTTEAGISTSFSLLGKNLMLYVPMYVDRSLLWGSIGLIYNCFAKLFLLPYSAVITINRFQALYFKQKPVYVIPNNIEQNPNAQLNAIETRRRLYFIGRLTTQKRLVELLKWLDHPSNKFVDMIIIGDGDERDKILELISNLKYISVTLKGWLNKTQQESLITYNDILVLNSAYEGDPLIIREANDRGSVVLSRNIVGVRASTYKAHRFDDQKALLNLLNLAYINNLRVYKNQSVQEIQEIRSNVAAKLFV